ncbi:thioredoxin [Anaerotignum lactatifermentans]|uniref:Thioredoxin n=1 Tax=Anaerotignum lactatifermentans TaxID=160404 RepID=A0ABS2G7V5_9FIRM|nr:thioredoxin [Anaerotignum lactatifermentans]MBM6828032.1 thioredoxin [Anaerotignum lactatifermentans]MBM6876805.1 thioredoxin [Anaerotignum lactatifermentans]MBM6949615.1 thioredoxin [Anaerotignum lactatifermentans]
MKHNVYQITKDNFRKEVLDEKKPVLLDFWAGWCGPCRMLSPVVEEVAEESSDVKVCKINIDEEPELAREFGVMSIPTLVYMKEGRIVDHAIGLRPKSAIVEMMKK